MITFSGLQKRDDEPDEQGRFGARSGESFSRIPIFLALMLTAIGAYLKGGTSASAGEAMAPDRPGKEPDAGSGPMGEQMGGRTRAALPERDDNSPEPYAVSSLDFEVAPIGGSNVVAFQPKMRGIFGADGAIQYASPQPRNGLVALDSQGAARGVMPMNDVGTAGGSISPSSVRTRASGEAEAQPATGDPAEPPPTDEDGTPPDTTVPPGEERRNRAPNVPSSIRLADVFAGQAVLIGLSELLGNATDPDGDELTVLNVSVSQGTVQAYEGFWVYIASASYNGIVSVMFQVSDGLAHIGQSAFFAVVGVIDGTVDQGSPENDHVEGTTLANSIWTYGGDDWIDAFAGNDLIEAGDGADTVYAGAGDDIVWAGAGADQVWGGDGNDLIMGEAGDDVLLGEAGTDTIQGGEGDDRIDGGDDADILSGDAGRDIIEGGQGDDTVTGGTGDDLVAGGTGDDDLSGDSGDDTVHGDAGDDDIQGGEGADSLFGGIGHDDIAGQDGDDYIEGDDGDDRIDAGAGADIVAGGNGADIIIVTQDGLADAYDGGGDADTGGPVAVDVLDASLATDNLTIDLVVQVISSEAMGQDNIANFEAITAGSGNDNFIIGAEAVMLTGGEGNDSFLFGRAQSVAPVEEELVHQIIDFMVGDMIKLDSLELTEAARDLATDLYQDFFEHRDAQTGQSISLRFRYERVDEMDHTIVDVDFDSDAVIDLSIDIYGLHRPFIFDTAQA